MNMYFILETLTYIYLYQLSSFNFLWIDNTYYPAPKEIEHCLDLHAELMCSGEPEQAT